MRNLLIRSLREEEKNLLDDFLYEAIFQRDSQNLLPRDIINQPELNVFIENFGGPDDFCLVAEENKKVVGAVWVRILSGNTKGFGNIDDNTPEFAIAVYNEYRSRGIGTKLMKSMLALLKEEGYQKTSLAVQKDNYAFNMYRKLGFETIKETDEEYIMMYKFDQTN